MAWFILFLLGAVIGSFLNVVILRYDGDHFVFDGKVLGGRSHCPHCKETLRWFELIPILSFLVQGGRCRRCRTKISFQYPIVEALSGCIFLFVPLRLGDTPLVFPVLWIIAFEILLLIACIDIRLGIIPDELNIALAVLGVFLLLMTAGSYSLVNRSSLGGSAFFFGVQDNLWTNHILGAFFGLLFFGIIIAVTEGRGMGMGDLKLAIPLGFFFGWPDIIFISALAFILGAIVGVSVVAFGKKTMKGSLPFGPFLAASAAVVFFCGAEVLTWYFRTSGL